VPEGYETLVPAAAAASADGRIPAVGVGRSELNQLIFAAMANPDGAKVASTSSLSSVATRSDCGATAAAAAALQRTVHPLSLAAPVLSFLSAHTRATHHASSDATAFSVVEETPNTGLVGVFKATSSRSAVFRAKSQTVMVDMCELLNQTEKTPRLRSASAVEAAAAAEGLETETVPVPPLSLLSGDDAIGGAALPPAGGGAEDDAAAVTSDTASPTSEPSATSISAPESQALLLSDCDASGGSSSGPISVAAGSITPALGEPDNGEDNGSTTSACTAPPPTDTDLRV
jgi:hypothetical protein